jgi:hypothetical protein
MQAATHPARGGCAALSRHQQRRASRHGAFTQPHHTSGHCLHHTPRHISSSSSSSSSSTRCRRQRAAGPLNALPIEQPLRELLTQAAGAHPGWLVGAAVNCAVFLGGAPVLLKGLTAAGMANAWLLGTAVFAAFGGGGFALVCLYFLFGTAVSM